MEKYKIYPRGGVILVEENACIPETIENTDWVEYLAWVAEGNTPEPADE